MRTTILSVVLLAACQGSTKTPPAPAPAEAEPASPAEAAVVSALDAAADPCVDFYEYACGGWEEATELPADRAVLVRGFTTIADRNEALLHDILEGLAANPPEDPIEGKLGRFYASCMDTEAIEARGAEPIAADLERLDAVTDTKSLVETAAWLHAEHGVTTLFGFYASPDEKNPDLNILHLSQPGLGLPDRDYYLDEGQAELVGQYQAYLQKLFELVGEEPAAAESHAAQVVALETALAEISWPRQDLRDTSKTYNKIDRAGVEELAPELLWDVYFEGIGKPDLTQINVVTPSYFEEVGEVLAAQEPEALRSWLRSEVIRSSAEHLSSAFDQASFDFYGKVLSGQQEQRPRWKRCVARTDAYLGDLLGQVYVDRAFAGESKDVALDMIGRIEGAFEGSLPALSWMDDTTREAAVAKARAVTNKIGYPAEWRDYGSVEVGEDYFANLVSASDRWLAEELAKLEQPVDKGEWYMTPPTVNAYYNPVANEIAFPAGILQPPLYGVDQPMSMNFGAIGMIVGHELTHGFDDQGRAYDATGRLSDWWDPQVVEAFEERAQCVDDLYSGFEVLPGEFVNGKLTLGENIADLGGLKLAWSAWKDWEAANGTPEAFAGMSHDQLFFVAYAQGWCTIARPEVEKMRLKTDPHSPPRYRVNGAVMSTPAFGEAFSCEEGAPMRPAEVCEVW